MLHCSLLHRDHGNYSSTIVQIFYYDRYSYFADSFYLAHPDFFAVIHLFAMNILVDGDADDARHRHENVR